jgi:Predicted transcriptional regulators
LDKLREFREQKGWTQDKLSQVSGVSRVTISLLESGQQTVTTNITILKLAKALGQSVADFF